MRVLIIGIDGYLGWSLTQYLSTRNHVVGGVDAYYRRNQVKEVGSQSAIPIADPNTNEIIRDVPAKNNVQYSPDEITSITG